jgi:MoxR-like ATPase
MSKAIKPMAVALQAGVPVLVIGAPGIGKTSVTNALAKALNAYHETVIASLREPSDFAGLPIIVDGDVRMAAPVWAKNLHRECKDGRRGILFLDEITTAPPAVQAALLRLCLTALLVSWYYPSLSALLLLLILLSRLLVGGSSRPR